eukprot:UN13116
MLHKLGSQGLKLPIKTYTQRPYLRQNSLSNEDFRLERLYPQKFAFFKFNLQTSVFSLPDLQTST